MSVPLSDRPVEVGDACLGPEILDQPDDVTVTMLVGGLHP